jgi:hypothetical protein
MFRDDSDEWFEALLLRDDITTSNASTAGTWQQLPAQHSDRRGLAGAVVAQEPEDLTRIYRERDVVDCSQTVECT